MYSPNLRFFSTDCTRACGTEITAHAHNCYEVVYFRKANGSLTLGSRTYPLHNGTIYIAYPGTPHSEIHTGDGRVSFLGFDCANFPRRDMAETAYNILRHKEIGDIIEKIIAEAIEQKQNYSAVISHMIAEIILLLQRYAASNEPQPKNLGYICSYISEYYNQPIDFNRLAAISGYSPDYFRHMFTREFGISPKQMQIDVRLKKAAELLLSSEKNCTEIAALCGFSTGSQFSRMFAEKYKLPPQKFRTEKAIL